jgi:hypothetical protein
VVLPHALVAVGDQLLQHVAGRLGVGAIAAEHAVEFKAPSRDCFQAGLLGVVEAVGSGDEQTEHKGRQGGDKARKAIDQVAGFAHLLVSAVTPGLVSQSPNPADEKQGRDEEREQIPGSSVTRAGRLRRLQRPQHPRR